MKVVKEIVLDLQDIFDAEPYPKEKLEVVEVELTVEDIEFFDSRGWKHYRPEHLYLLPVLGETLYLGEGVDPVVEINGKRWKVTFEFDYNYEPYEVNGKKVIFRQTNEPLTKSEVIDDNRHSRFMQVFGQPAWVQGKHYPAYQGKPCYHLATLEVGWGDCGNYNILIACDEQGDPTVAFFEASCC